MEGPTATTLTGAILKAKDPVVAAFHILFKGLALFIYVFGRWFSSNDVFLFVLIILMLASDFWVVSKRASPRLSPTRLTLLVGLEGEECLGETPGGTEVVEQRQGGRH